jgi:hypothetical protein
MANMVGTIGSETKLVTRLSLLADGLQRRSLDSRPSTTTFTWITAGFLVSTACVIGVVLIFGADQRIPVALQITARWSFVLFWLAYCGSAMAKLFGERFAALARRGRDFGLAFASAQFPHFAIVAWLLLKAPKSSGGMAFFWVGIFCTYLLALLSLPSLNDALGSRAWRTLRTAAMEYIALVFAADFILGPLQANGFSKYPLTYVPFALLLVGGGVLRATANIRAQHR